MKKINNYIFKYLFIIFIFLCLLYSIIKYILLQNLDYKNYIALNNIFSEKEIKDIQDCIGNKENINSCFEKHQSNILSKIKDKLNISYMSIGLARLSNNNNNDAQNYHRDIKISNNYKGEYPNIYTIICYFDDASLLMGNETINSKPGDGVGNK